MTDTITAYKGFDMSWRCRDMQYEIGKTYEHDSQIIACKTGYHACENPLDVFGYYPPGQSRYAVVAQNGSISRDSDDTKIASARITITEEITLHDMISRAVDWLVRHATKRRWKHATGYQSAAAATGDLSAAAATGDQSAAAATGDQSAAAATGDQSAAAAIGSRSAAAATGDQSAAAAIGSRSAAAAIGSRSAAAATGYLSAAAATGSRSAAAATGDQSAAAATGYLSAAAATGDRSAAAATGDQSAAAATGYLSAAAAIGNQSAAMATGFSGRVSGKTGNALFLVIRSDNGDITHTWAGIVGRDGIKEDVWYSLNSDGVPEEVT